MDIISNTTINMGNYGKITTCRVHCIHVKVKSISNSVTEMTRTISDTSWINKLDTIPRITFEATSRKTIDKLVNDILSKVVDNVTDEFGEYLVSYTAQHVLELGHSHNKVPLAELLKEKMSGNPGFDFHTESVFNHIAFGEAKYSATETPRADALNQICEFIQAKKDDMELNMLQHFVSSTAVNNYEKKKKGYVAAFSLNAQNVDTIFKNALDSNIINSFMGYEELYLIAVEV